MDSITPMFDTCGVFLGGVRTLFGLLKVLIAFHTTRCCVRLLHWKRLLNTAEKKKKTSLFYFLCGEGRHSLEEGKKKANLIQLILDSKKKYPSI